MSSFTSPSRHSHHIAITTAGAAAPGGVAQLSSRLVANRGVANANAIGWFCVVLVLGLVVFGSVAMRVPNGVCRCRGADGVERLAVCGLSGRGDWSRGAVGRLEAEMCMQ